MTASAVPLGGLPDLPIASAVVGTLVVGVVVVMVTTTIKVRQLSRWRRAQAEFERRLESLDGPLAVRSLLDAENWDNAIAAALCRAGLSVESGRQAAIEREFLRQRRRVMQMMVSLGTVASVAPFVGLLGTVYGILDAFVQIGLRGSASLAVVAPAVGEALGATALGLVAAIPAVVSYNALGERLTALLDEGVAISRLAFARFDNEDPT